MPDQSVLDDLLDELLDSGRTPEEVCEGRPELLPEVRLRWQRICDLRDELDAWLPPSNGGTADAPLSSEAAPLPQIPGYEVEAVVGRGGMGVVFRARQLRLNRLVAVKMALAGSYAGPSERERFVREAETAAKLRHPNIVAIYDVGEAGGQAYYTMEYVEGGTLAETLAGAPQPARQACAIVAALAGAVDAAHQSGVVHRDLKPANVLLTPDGTPKISDFGLARSLDGGAGLTQSGAAVGTPSYMAPEQARHSKTPAGPPADVYALGAILYELLTGRPPFRAKTAVETVQLVVGHDPVPPSRLAATVPRDVETICLRCLQKEPLRRYGSAARLADDLNRFLRGEAISARPEGRLERLARWVRRRPILSAAVATVLLTAAGGGTGAWWLISERAEEARVRAAERAATERAAEDDLNEMAALLQMARWPEARAALDRATVRIGDRGSDGVRQRLDRGARDLAFVARLDAIRLDRSDSDGGVLAYARAVAAYEDEFREAGYGSPVDAPAAVSARIRESDIHTALVAALDDWASLPGRPERREWILGVARLADRHPTPWRAGARDPATRADKAALVALTAAARVEEESVPLLVAIASALSAVGGDPVPFLTRVRGAHPTDFWVNINLGGVLDRAGQHEEAVRYFQVAQALRPGAAIVYHNLGIALARSGRPSDAAEQYQTALRLDATNFPAHFNLAIVLGAAGRHEEAIRHAETGLRLNPDSAILRSAYADSLHARGRTGEALAQYRQAVALDPRLAGTQRSLRSLLIREGKPSDARAAWAKAIEAGPGEHEVWDGYAEFCLLLGETSEYARARKLLLDRFGSTTDPHIAERTARACLLSPAPDEEVRRARALIDFALVERKGSPPSWAKPYFLFAKGLAEYRAGRFEDAQATLTGDASKVLGPAPRLVLAMSQHRLGQTEQARKTLAAAVESFDWKAAAAESRETWIYRVLRSEAERTLAGEALPAASQGADK